MSELLGSMPAIKKLPGETDEELIRRIEEERLKLGLPAPNKNMTGVDLDVKVPPGMEGASREELVAAAQSVALQGRDGLGKPLITVDTKPTNPFFSLGTGNLNVTEDPFDTDKEPWIVLILATWAVRLQAKTEKKLFLV